MQILKVIKKYGWSLEAVAKELGITKGTFSVSINRNPTTQRLIDVANVLGCSPAEFFADWDTAPENKHQKVSTDETLLEAPQEQMPQQAAENLPFNNDEEKPTAQGIFICPHCGKGVTIEVKG